MKQEHRKKAEINTKQYREKNGHGTGTQVIMLVDTLSVSYSKDFTGQKLETPVPYKQRVYKTASR
jgi:hypothetical protein